jgi:hypothetical protein
MQTTGRLNRRGPSEPGLNMVIQQPAPMNGACEAADEQPVVLGLRHTTSNRLGGRAVDLTGGGAISALLCRSV